MRLKSIVKEKKSVMNQLISVGILVLVISVLFGLTFLFVSSLKDQVATTATGGNASTAWKAVNATEGAGYTIVSYLPLVFLALIFGAIMVLVLKIIIPYMDLGRDMGGGF